MVEWLYTLRQRFTSSPQEAWDSYRSFSGFAHIEELITLDFLMCPNLVTELIDEDWDHNVNEDFRITLFRDPGYLRRRMPFDPDRHQILALKEHPAESEVLPEGAMWCGFDLLDSYCNISTLTNCGPAPEVFQPSEVNRWGLIDDWQRAYRIRDDMRRMSPEDAHFRQCDVWLVARVAPVG